MSQVTHNDELVTKTDLASFYQGILPYLGGNAEAGFTPVGTVISVMGNSAPAHYLVCDGTVYNIADYLELSDYFYQQFGSKNYFGGDGTTTFAVPDLRGEFLRGSGTNGHTSQGDGATVGTHQDGTEIPYFIAGGDKNIYYSSGKAPANMDSELDTATQHKVTGTAMSSTVTKGYTSRPTNTSILFCIATKNIFMNPSLDYSTSEKVVGTWIDGKPVYQKTVDCGALPNATNKKVAHNIANLGMIVDYFGVAYNSTASEYQSMNRPGISNSTYGISIIINGANISIDTGTDRRAFTVSYVTIQYTKTTD